MEHVFKGIPLTPPKWADDNASEIGVTAPMCARCGVEHNEWCADADALIKASHNEPVKATPEVLP